MPDPRSPSLDAAVEAFEAVFYAEHPQDAVRPLRDALEAALPHLQLGPPSGGAQEPSEEAVEAAEQAWFVFQEPNTRPVLGGQMRVALAAAYAMDFERSE